MGNEPEVERAHRLLDQTALADAALFDALTDEVGVMDVTGRILVVNAAWERFFRENGGDPSAGACVGHDYLDVCRRSAAAGSASAADALHGLERVLNGALPQFSLEYECDSPSVTRRFLMTAMSLGARQGAMIWHRDITERKKLQEALHLGDVVIRSAFHPDVFLGSLLKSVGSALKVAHAFITELEDPATLQVKMLAHWNSGRYGKLLQYVAAGTPCEQVLKGIPLVVVADLRSMFWATSYLDEMSAESYMGLPLLSSTGSVIGHIALVGTRPIEDASFASNVLRIFAARAAPEVERRRRELYVADQARLIENAHDAIIGTDPRFLITSWNRAAEVIYGWRSDEVLGLPIAQVLQTGITEEERAEAVRIAQATGEYRGEMVQRRRDGSLVHIEATTMAFRDAVGGLRGYVTVNRDITARKRAEQDLRQAEAQNAALLRAIPDMMFTLDGAGTFVQFRPARGLRPLIPEERFIGRTVADVMPPELSETIMDAIRAALKTGELQRFEYDLLEDEKKHYEARVVPLADEKVLAIVRDKTAERRQLAEEQRRRSIETLEGAVERQMLRSNPYGLTFREFTVLHLIATGLADKEIADQLGLSVFTASKHVANILSKMNALSRTEAAVRAYREGLLAATSDGSSPPPGAGN